MVSASALEPVDPELYPGLCSYSVFAIICNASLLKVRPMVTSKLAANLFHTCTLVISNMLQACRFAVQVCYKLKLLSGSEFQISDGRWRSRYKHADHH
ncbi:hypothetical protein AVEN_47350-1 [Araneus ventricosus]|uniref:Uncharacterized protein n=1 Tax=Araneus ventricosus TaxID=182803 RepID=A0A4Y2FC70_ARAVE|nr:hypothetical protein AVEN_47350-1 [Araneus ventricosus]